MTNYRIQELKTRLSVNAKWSTSLCRFFISKEMAEGVFVSLTSFPPRYPTLGLTLKSLLMQDIRPEAILLWIASKDIETLPSEVRALERYGLRIIECDDLRSYKKYIFALSAFPDYKIAICDDDTFYPTHWLRDLLEPVAANEIAGHRLHKIRLFPDGMPMPYQQWDHEGGSRISSPLNYSTGVGGVLLELRKLDPEIFNIELAMALCPTADDIWLYFMGRRAGSKFIKVGKRLHFINWRSSQAVALWQTNNIGDQANDRQFRALIEHYGREGLFE